MFLPLTWAEDDIEEDALNEQLKKGLDDRLEHIKQVLVLPVVLLPVALDEDNVIDASDLGRMNVSLGWGKSYPTMLVL